MARRKNTMKSYPTNPSSRTRNVHYGARKLGEVCEVKKGKKPELFGVQTKTRLPYLEAKFMRGTKESKFAEKSDKNSVPVNKGDLIIICDGSKSGDVFSGFEGILSSTMSRIDFDRGQVDKIYLELFLKTKFNLFNFSKKGAAIPHLDFNIFKNLEIPLPPIAEQRKLVAKLEKVLKKIKEAKKLREETESAAVALLPAELHRIFTQPTTPHKQHTNKLEYVGMSGKPAFVKNYSEAQWEEKELGEICEKTTNIKWNNYKNNNFQYVDLTSVSRDDFLITETKEVNSRNAPSRAKKVIKTNDVIFGTTRPTLMRVARVPAEFNNHICSTGFTVLRAKKEHLLPQFIYYFIRSERFMNRMESVQTGASYPAVSDAKVLETKIPPPPLAEQKKIVARLDSLSEKICRLRECQKSTAFDLISLEQSILSKSFSG